MRKKLYFKILVLLTVIFMMGCMPKVRNGMRGKLADGALINSPSTVEPGYGRIFPDNFIALSGNKELPIDVDFTQFLGKTPVFITNDQFLNGDCENVYPCYTVKIDNTAIPLHSPTTKWAYPIDSPEFLQVHTFGHTRIVVELFQKMLKKFSNNTQNWEMNVPKTTAFPGPFNLYATKAFWLGGTTTLMVYSECDLPNNSTFTPATFSVCMGRGDGPYKHIKWAHDPTVLYHEIGHSFVHVLSNMRNIASGTVVEKVRLGHGHFDEAGSLNEGFADFTSYWVNLRPHIGEWAMGNQSRPMTELDPIHAPGISKSENERLSYPHYLDYDANFPEELVEDIHLAGQIISHYLVSLAEDFRDHCKMELREAVDNVYYLLGETLAYLGDLTTRGLENGNINSVNHKATTPMGENMSTALLWYRTVKPVNYRSFAQTFARSLLKVHGNPLFALCDGAAYPKDRIEELLDQYGLLLFKNYNQNGDSEATGHLGLSTQVNEANRRRSVLIPKNLIKIDPRPGATSAYIFDAQDAMLGVVQNLTALGNISGLSSLIDPALSYNNNNGLVSPGEFVGISLNLYNDSNSIMAGVQVLANNWDHVKEDKPCNTFSDHFPASENEGAAQTAVGEGTIGGCDYVSRDNGEFSDSVDPICLIQDSTAASTVWLTQEKYRQINNDDPTNCLDSTDTRDCYFRAVKGADQAMFSKIDPKKTWGETITGVGKAPHFSSSNIIFFEANPNIKPGTQFYCRFRVRFTNCEDCYVDPASPVSDDYLDYEYSGARPFQIVPFQFTVLN